MGGHRARLVPEPSEATRPHWPRAVCKRLLTCVGRCPGRFTAGACGGSVSANMTPVVAAALLLGAGPAPEAAVDFDRDVRPLLSDHCFRCHGPDPGARKAGLRLDTREGAMADHDGMRAVVPGDPEHSALLERLNDPDDDDRMPPAKA